MEAIGRAELVIGWERNLLPDEMPPRKFWMDNEKLRDWFAEVDRKREDKVKGDGGSASMKDAERNPLIDKLVVGG